MAGLVARSEAAWAAWETRSEAARDAWEARSEAAWEALVWRYGLICFDFRSFCLIL